MTRIAPAPAATHDRPVARLLTCADLAVLPSELPSGPVDFELDDGRLVIMVPPSGDHGAVQVKIGAQLLLQGEMRGFGKAWAEVGIILRRNPDRVVGADAAFATNRSLPIRESREGYLETVPDLVVEVRSKNDALGELDAKVRDYLEAGAQVVWVLDPARRTVTAHRPDAAVATYSEQDTLTVEDLIPGFRILAANLF